MRVRSLWLYPVKSTGGVPVPVADVDRPGLRGDRRWMVVNDTGAVVTARDRPALLQVRATPGDDGSLTLTAPGRPDLPVACPAGAQRVPVGLSRVGWANPADEAAHAWLSEVVADRVRLVWLDDPGRRPVSDRHGGRPGDPLSLADAGPLLVTTTASLAALNAWVAQERAERGEPATDPLSMQRFRPNVVLDGDFEPFAEDAWQGVRLGEVLLRFAEHCDRCVLTTVDPLTLARGKEPVRTLARYRRWDGQVWFGVRMVPVSTGRVAVGDHAHPVRGEVQVPRR